MEIETIDARGNSVQVRKLALPATGLAETSFQSAHESPSGVYAIKVLLVRHEKRDFLLGETSALVKELQPDRMKIEAHLSKEAKGGWATPENVRAAITLRNLYGAPASERRVKACLELSPAAFRFDQFEGFTFFDRLYDEKKGAQITNRGAG